MRNQQPICLLDRIENRLLVKRHERPRVDDFCRDAFVGEFVCSSECLEHHPRGCKDSDVIPLAFDFGDTQRNRIFLFGDVSLFGIEEFMLNKHDWVVITDGGFQQAFRIVGRSRHDNEEAGDMHKPCLQTLRMLRRRGTSGTALRPNHQRHIELSPNHIANLGYLIDNLIHADGSEVNIHQFGDRTHAGNGSTEGSADDGGFGDRRVADASLAELLEEAIRHLVGTPVFGDILAHQKDCFVAVHLLNECFFEGIAIGNRFHCSVSSSSLGLSGLNPTCGENASTRRGGTERYFHPSFFHFAD